jgi:hypothetical protein
LIAKFPSLVSLVCPSWLVTLIRSCACVVAGLVTFQVSAPSFGALLPSSSQLAPVSRELDLHVAANPLRRFT